MQRNYLKTAYYLKTACILIACTAIVGCGSVDSLLVEGETGQVTPVSMVGEIPAVDVAFDGAEPLPFLIDTGSPLTILSEHAYADRAGTVRGDLEAFGLRMEAFAAQATALFTESEVCADVTPGGLVGADLLTHFGLGIDVQNQTAMLLDAEAEAQTFGEHTEAPHTVPFELLGGGTVTLGTSKRSVSRTRIVVPVEVEGISTHAVVDSGATLTLLDGRLYGSLTSEGRPATCCKSVLLQDSGETLLNLTRVRHFSVNGVDVPNMPAVVLPNGSLTEALSKETGREIRVVIGAPFLRHFAYQISYERQELYLYRYSQPELHIDDDEYVMPGFTYCKAKDASQGIFVTEVFEGTDAANQGVITGARIVAINGEDVAELNRSEIDALLRSVEPGETVGLTFDIDGQQTTLDITLQDILPEI